MRNMFTAGLVAFTLVAIPVAVQAGTLEGVAIGAGSGALIAGPPGAIVGGVIGGVVGGPNVVPRKRYRQCWTNRNGNRQCRWR
ncbi:MAG: hypothetical protein Q8M26_10310 [Pseudolabrys sp.]|nr:hypothetical protein [Pseudolabrys sp.]